MLQLTHYFLLCPNYPNKFLIIFDMFNLNNKTDNNYTCLEPPRSNNLTSYQDCAHSCGFGFEKFSVELN